MENPMSLNNGLSISSKNTDNMAESVFCEVHAPRAVTFLQREPMSLL